MENMPHLLESDVIIRRITALFTDQLILSIYIKSIFYLFKMSFYRVVSFKTVKESVSSSQVQLVSSTP